MGGGRFKKVILADIFESLMGAIYLDLGFDTVKRVEKHFVKWYNLSHKIIINNT